MGFLFFDSVQLVAGDAVSGPRNSDLKTKQKNNKRI